MCKALRDGRDIERLKGCGVPTFSQKIVLITGGGSGFGAAMARRFAEAGAAVVVADINDVAAKAVADDLPVASSVRVDVSRSDEVAAMVAHAEDRFGGLDVLVNNAGLTHRAGPVEELAEEEFDRIVSVNFKGAFLGAKYGIPALRRRGGGVIINTASIGAISPRPGVTAYNASKGAVLTLTLGLAAELAPTIRVNAVMPVAAHTNFMLGAFGGELPERSRAAFVKTIPMGRLCEPTDVAAAVCFLASDDARFLTGVCLPVDGGRSI
jgi:3-oxoacyl-[acyl-carrier protein] reductase